jgi:hypothetical protein
LVENAGSPSWFIQTLLIARNVWRRMVGWLVNNELERAWREVAVA